MGSVRRRVYYAVKSVSGSKSPQIFEERMREFRNSIPEDTADCRLRSLLRHACSHVPFYRPYLEDPKFSAEIDSEPRTALLKLPVLTRNILSDEFTRLKSDDLNSRRDVRTNTSGGSTGEPVRMIQDGDYRDQASANTLLYSALVGKLPGELEVRLWGSERDVFENGVGWKAQLQFLITNTRFLNAFRMTPDRMRAYIELINESRPRFVLAYAQALFELCQFARDEGISIRPPNCAMTSAGTLHPFMKETIRNVLGCEVYNRYGSREVGDVACEIPHSMQPGGGLWVAPWNAIIETIDAHGNAAGDGVEGDILVTSLCNYAMPLLRYRIGDRGVLRSVNPGGPTGQVLKRVAGRVTDNFRTRAGRVIPGEYFVHLIGVVLNTGVIRKFQVIQRDYEHVEVRIVAQSQTCNVAEIVNKIQIVMGGEACRVDVVYTDAIPESESGKYRYTISMVAN